MTGVTCFDSMSALSTSSLSVVTFAPTKVKCLAHQRRNDERFQHQAKWSEQLAPAASHQPESSFGVNALRKAQTEWFPTVSRMRS